MGADAMVAAATASGERLRGLYDRGELCDVTLIAGAQRFRAHRAMLAAMSPNFRKFVRDGATATGDDCPMQGLLVPPAPPPAPVPAADAATEAPSVELTAAAAAAALPVAAGEPAEAEAASQGQTPAVPQAPAQVAGVPPSPAAAAAHPAPVAPLVAAHPAAAEAAAPAAVAAEQVACLSALAAVAPGAEPPQQKSQSPPATALPAPCEFEVTGLSSPEALNILLRFVYDVGTGADWSYEPSSADVNKDVLRLTAEGRFGLAALHEHAARWLAKGLTTANVVGRLVTCEEFGLGLLREKMIEQLTNNPEELRSVSSSCEIMKHPHILQDLLIQLASLSVRPKVVAVIAPKEEPEAQPSAEKADKKATADSEPVKQEKASGGKHSGGKSHHTQPAKKHRRGA